MRIVSFIFFILFSLTALAESEAILSVTLSPAGSFQAVSKKPKGKLIKKGNAFETKKISVRIETFKTGIDLRDEHFWKHLNSKKHSKAILTDLKAENGKGTAQLEVNGVKQPIQITYSEKGNEVKANFSVKASSFSLAKAEYLGVGVADEVKVDVTLPFKVK